MASKFKKTNYPNLLLNIKSGNYYWREYLKGKEYFLSTKECSIGKALTKIKLLRQKVGEDQIIFLERSYLFDDVFNLILEVQKSKSHKTYLSARTQIENHLRPWFQKNCSRIDFFIVDYEKYWSQYVQYQKIKNEQRKLEHDRRHLIMALHKAKNKGLIKRSLGKLDLPLKESSQSIGQYIEDKDIIRILSRVKTCDKFYLQVMMALTMGMRRSEILQLQKTEINWTRNEINLDPSRLKTRMARKVAIPISDKVRPLLLFFYNVSKGRYLFPAIFRQLLGHPEDFDQPQTELPKLWRQVKKELRLNYRFHDLRHTAITNMISEGLPLSTVSKIVGASEKTINRIYDHIRQDVKNKFSSLFNNRF